MLRHPGGRSDRRERGLWALVAGKLIDLVIEPGRDVDDRGRFDAKIPVVIECAAEIRRDPAAGQRDPDSATCNVESGGRRGREGVVKSL